jgi:hypothetical protein
MANKERQGHRVNPALSRTEGVEPTEAPAANVAMDRWFQQQLTLLYNDVVNEPLPKEFLEILGKIGKDKPTS